jgi:hypothetical protein
MRTGYKDLVSGGVLLSVAVLMFWAASKVPRVLALGIDSGFVPRFLAICLACTCVPILYRGIRELSQRPPPSSPDVQRGGGLLILATFLLVAMYIGLLEKIGFLLMTSVYLVGQFSILAGRGHRRPVIFVVAAILVSVAIYYTFVKVFNLMLPAGILG